MNLENIPEDVKDKIEVFEPQYETNDCLSTCIRNIIRKISFRKTGKKNLFNLSKSDVNNYTEYDELGASTADMKRIKKGLDKDLKVKEMRCVFQFTNQTKNFGIDFQFIKNIILNDNKSLPIVSLSTDYYDDSNFPWQVPDSNRFPHTVITLEINDEKVYIWDGLISYKADNNIIDGIIKMPKERFIRYWDNYYYSREVCWLEMEAKKEVDSY